jgi:hypothetical protein
MPHAIQNTKHSLRATQFNWAHRSWIRSLKALIDHIHTDLDSESKYCFFLIRPKLQQKEIMFSVNKK